MQDSNLPLKFSIPWAASAPGTNIVNPVPVAPQGGGQGSLTDGFPPINSTAIGGGGIPPFGNVTNGILYMLSAAVRWTQAGGQWPYDGTFQTAIGGYAEYAVVMSLSNPGTFWMSFADNNGTDPDTGGGGWTAWPFNYYASDTGSVNALAVTLPVSLAAIPVGTVLRVNPAFTSTGTTPTLNVNGGGGVTVTTPAGAALAVGAITRLVPAAIMVGTAGALWLLNPQTATSGVVTVNGQCRLVYSSATTVTLIPAGGTGIVINNILQTVPGGGVVSGTPGALGLAASTGYYVYAAFVTGAIVLNFSTTGPAVASNGVTVKSGDSTQTLVGMVYLNASTQFGPQGNGTWSYYNRLAQGAVGVSTAGASTTSTSATELAAGARVVVASFGDCATTVVVSGYPTNVGISGPDYSGDKLWVGIDGSTVGLFGWTIPELGNPTPGPVQITACASAQLAQGFHTVSPFGASSTTGPPAGTAAFTVAANVVTMG